MSTSTATAGAWLHNPVTDEVARLNRVEDRHVGVDLWLQPGAAVARAHIHDRLIERYEVVDGAIGFLAGGGERVGDGVVEVPAGAVHDWWNGGDDTAHRPRRDRGRARSARSAGRPLPLADRGDVVARRARAREPRRHARRAVAGRDRARTAT